MKRIRKIIPAQDYRFFAAVEDVVKVCCVFPNPGGRFSSDSGMEYELLGSRSGKILIHIDGYTYMLEELAPGETK